MTRTFRGKCCRLVILTLTIAICAACVPCDTFAGIVIGQGIAGIRLGESYHQTTRRLGKPASVVPPDLFYGAPLDGHVGFGFKQRVNDIETSSTAQRTSRHVGPGASAQSVLRAYPRLKCYRNTPNWSMICLVISRYNHRPVETDFLFRAQALREVDIFIRGA
jgi:hypothetical protein